MDYSIITGKDFSKIRKEVKDLKEKNKGVVFVSEDDELNRKVLEKVEIDVLLLKCSGRKDFMKQRSSGFNHVLGKIAQKNKVKIGIDLDEIIEASEKEKLEILARVQQNIKLCNKNKLKMVFIGIKHKKNLYDLKALGLVLGMPTWMTKEL